MHSCDPLYEKRRDSTRAQCGHGTQTYEKHMSKGMRHMYKRPHLYTVRTLNGCTSATSSRGTHAVPCRLEVLFNLRLGHTTNVRLKLVQIKLGVFVRARERGTKYVVRCAAHKLVHLAHANTATPGR